MAVDGKGMSEFQKLLRALSQQYERDVFAAQNSQEKLKMTAQADAHGSDQVRDASQPQAPPGDYVAAEPQKDMARSISLPNEVVPVLSPSGETATSQGSSDADDADKRVQRWSSVNDLVSAQVSLKQRQSSMKIKREAAPTAFLEGTRLGAFVKSSLFDKIVAVMLLLNAAFIGVQVDAIFTGDDEHPAIIVIDYLFAVFFIAEIVLRMLGTGFKAFWIDPDVRLWNYFDFIVVGSSTVDSVLQVVLPKAPTQTQSSPLANISMLRIIRILRVARVVRVIRIMKFFRDLRILLAAIVSTVKTAYFALILIFLIMYMFGVALTQLVADYVIVQTELGNEIPDDASFYFGSLADSLFTMFMTLAGGIDWKDAHIVLREAGGFAVFLYVVFVIIMILCVLNVLTGIFCQCAIEAAATDKDNIISVQMQDRQHYINTIASIFEEIDDSGDGKCSLAEFKAHIHLDSVQALLNSLDIELHDAFTLFEMLDADGTGDVDLDEFVTGCITLRGGAKAVQIEKVQSMVKCVFEEQAKMQSMLDRLVHMPHLRNPSAW